MFYLFAQTQQLAKDDMVCPEISNILLQLVDISSYTPWSICNLVRFFRDISNKCITYFDMFPSFSYQ